MPRPIPRTRATVLLKVQPHGILCSALAGDTILDAALDNGLEIAHECGGNCSCTTCHVRILEGAGNLTPMEEPEEYRIQFADGVCERSRLACQAILKGGIVSVEICGS